MVPKWLVVARNEYRIQTSKIRKIRPYFPIIAISLLAVYVAFIAPAFVSLFLDDFLAFLLSQAAIAMVQIILFTIFIYFMIIPIASTLREEKAGQLEIFLAAPVKPSDVLLGEYLGGMPFYVIFVTVVTGLFTSLLSPLHLDMFQVAIIVLIFVVTFLSASWIGTVIAAILRTRLGKTAHGKDVGRALAMIIALPMVALIYAIQFGGLLQALADPGTSGTVKAVLGLLPSSWGADIIVGFALNPRNMGAVVFETFTRFGGLVAFFCASLFLGAKAANRAYSLEPTTFISSTAKPDGVFYKTVKYLGGGGSFGTLLVSVFKDYSRRLENLSNITYMIGVLLLMTIFVTPGIATESDVPFAYWIAPLQFIAPVIVVMITGEVTVRGKDNLFIYRKAPSGESRLVKAMLLRSWLIAVPILGATTAAVIYLASQPDPISLLATTGLMMLFVAAYAALVLGLFLLSPAFSEKSVKLFLNVIIAVFVSIGLFATSIAVSTMVFPQSDPIRGMLYLQLFQTGLSWMVGIVFLYLGKRRLSRIE